MAKLFGSTAEVALGVGVGVAIGVGVGVATGFGVAAGWLVPPESAAWAGESKVSVKSAASRNFT